MEEQGGWGALWLLDRSWLASRKQSLHFAHLAVPVVLSSLWGGVAGRRRSWPGLGHPCSGLLWPILGCRLSLGATGGRGPLLSFGARPGLGTEEFPGDKARPAPQRWGLHWWAGQLPTFASRATGAQHWCVVGLGPGWGSCAQKGSGLGHKDGPQCQGPRLPLGTVRPRSTGLLPCPRT